MSEQLSIFAPAKSCAPAEIHADDLAGLTIKEQLTRLVHFSCGDQGLNWTAFSRRVVGLDEQMIFDVRDNRQACPAELSAKICEVFKLSTFPIDPAPMLPPVMPRPWFDTVMEKPENDFVNARPRDSYIVLAQGNPYHPVQEKYVLGPYQTCFVEALPLADRAEVIAFWRTKPYLNHCVDVMTDADPEQPSRKLTEEQKQGRRLLNLLRRCLKKYGMLAEELARAEVQAKGWEWSDEAWAKAQKPPKAGKVKAKRAARHKTDNDELMR